MQRTFPISELFKTNVVGFNVDKIEFHEGQGLNTICLQCSIATIALLKATLSFNVHESDFFKVKSFLLFSPIPPILSRADESIRFVLIVL